MSEQITTTDPTTPDPESWVILELFGHVRMAGKLTEVERFGAKMGRIDCPTEAGGFTTVFFGGSSIYRMTPVSEALARKVAYANEPRPVHAYESAEPESVKPVVSLPAHRRFDPDDDDDDRDDDLF